MVSVDGDHGDPSARNDAPTRCRAPPGPVTTGRRAVETHVSSVVFDGDLVHKRKKPVRFAFIDLSTPERRRQVCHQEVALNRRFSPDVYLGVEEVVDDEGRVVDHAVRMRRMPADRRLATLVRQHRDVARCLRSVARIMAACHAGSATSKEISRLRRRRRCTTCGTGTCARSNRSSPTRSMRRSSPGSAGSPVAICTGARGCSRSASPGAASSTDTATCSPTTSSASTTVPASSTGSSSTSGSAGAMCCTTSAFLAMDLERLGRLDLARQLPRLVPGVLRRDAPTVARAPLHRLPGAGAGQDRLPAGRRRATTAQARGASGPMPAPPARGPGAARRRRGPARYGEDDPRRRPR